MVMDLISPSSGALVFQIVFKTLNNVSSTVRRCLCKIVRFKVVNLKFDLGLLNDILAWKKDWV